MVYRREIDGLRAIAVLLVILFHAGFSAFSGGYVGVDVFFVISGYLITTIIINDLERDRFSIIEFYERRARRILPALFFVILCCIPFAYFWMGPQQLKDFSQAIFSIAFFVSNILFFIKEDYFSPAAEENPLLHTWSLAVEEQFYIFFPVMMIIMWRRGNNCAFYAIIILCILSFILSEWAWRHFPSANFYLLPSRAWELGVGSICAFAIKRHTVKPNSYLALLGLALVLYAVLFFDESTPFPSAYALIPVVGAALIVLFASSSNIVGRFLSRRALVGVGLVSYSAYLLHQPIFAFARIISYEHPDSISMGLLALLSLGLAYLTWRFVEQPFRVKRSGFHFSRGQIFSISALMIISFSVVGLYGHIKDGMPGRLMNSAINYQFYETARPSARRGECHATPARNIAPDAVCIYGSAERKIAVIGDSHAVELAYAMGNMAAEHGFSVIHYSFSGCAPSYMKESNGACEIWTKESVDYIKAQKDIDHVIVTYRLSSHLAGDHYGYYPNVPTQKPDEVVNEIVYSLSAMLDAFSAHGKSVYFVDQAPELPKHIHNMIIRNGGGGDILIGASLKWWQERRPFIGRIISIVGKNKFIDVEDIFCNDEVCFAGVDGVSYYFDDDHMSVSGATKVGERVFARLLIDSASDRVEFGSFD